MVNDRSARRRTVVYVSVAAVFGSLLWRIESTHHKIEDLIEREAQATLEVEAESARTDRAFCFLIASGRQADNLRNTALRDAAKIAFFDRPEIRDKVLSEIPEDLPLIDCNGIGDRRPNFSEQPGIDALPTLPSTLPPTTTTTTTGGS